MKRFAILALAALTLGLTGAARDIHQAQKDIFRSKEYVLIEFVGTVDLDDECLFPIGNNHSNAASVVCTNLATPFFVTRAAHVTRIISVVLVTGTAGYGCIVQPLVEDSAVGTAQTIATSAAAGVLTSTDQAFTVSAGEELEIQMLDGVDALLCDAGTNPRFRVTVIGYWIE